MLHQLMIRNFALIDSLSIDFSSGLSVMTGETGAGKSIVVDAVCLLLGGRADKDMIRSGESKAYIEGVFLQQENEQILSFLKEQALDTEEDGIILSREINSSGRSVSRVNGVLVNIQTLRLLGALLMEMHGQHEHQLLLTEEKHIDFLDLLGDERHETLIRATGEAFNAYYDTEKSLTHAIREYRIAENKLEVLGSQLKEIEQAKLSEDEEEDLLQKRDLLRNADKIERSLKASYALLYDASDRDESVLQALKQTSNTMQGIAAYNPLYQALYERVESLYYETEDIGLTLQKELRTIHSEGSSLEEIESRIDLIRKLEKKYGTSIAEVLRKKEEIQTEISYYQSLDNRIDELTEKQKKAKQLYRQVSTQLSQSRQQLGKKMCADMEQQLSQLNMKNAKFYVDITKREEQFSGKGQDTVCFMIAPNRGEEKHPLSKTASGGELSRLMLAIKSLVAEKMQVSTMVFDEIDTGISGKTATEVARKLWDIARSRQVICVTHLQQIASMASNHYMVRKTESGNRTITQVELLSREGREHEIARMLGEIDDQSESAIKHAQAMLNDALDYRNKTNRGA